MKKFITFKQLKSRYDLVICGGNFSEIAKSINPVFYHYGKYGWDCDIITGYFEREDRVYSVAICLGYRCAGMELKGMYEFMHAKNELAKMHVLDEEQFWNDLQNFVFKD